MSYRTQKSTSASWLLNKAASSVQEWFYGFEGYRIPFSERRLILFIVDGILILLSTWLAFLVWGFVHTGALELTNEQMASGWYWFGALLLGWWVLAWLNDLYDIPSSYHATHSLFRIAVVALLALFVYLFVYFGAPVDALPRIFFRSFLFTTSLLIYLWRLGYVRLSAALPFTHRVFIVGMGNRAHTITTALDLSPGLNYEIIGYIDDGTFADSASVPGDRLGLVRTQPSTGAQLASPVLNEAADMPILGHVDHLSALIDSHKIHEVIIALEDQVDRDLFDSLVDCQARGIYISWMPKLYEQLLRRIPLQDVDPTWALQATSGQPIFGRIQQTLKRVIDIGMTLLALPTILIAIPLIGLAIWLDTGGPIFYKQQRCGRGNKPFTIYKFRTMTVNAEKEGEAQWASQNDSRVTRVGKFLRRTRLDELPQLFNILQGQMSIVGPRPERPEFVQNLQEDIPYYRARLMVKPGLTGWAQVHYRYGSTNEDAEVKLSYDLYYIQYWSIWLDLYTMFRTFGVVFRLEGV